MVKFLIGSKRTLEDKETPTSSKTLRTSANLIIKSKTRKFDQAYIAFASSKISVEEKPQCDIC